jgi:hypothetical protein
VIKQATQKGLLTSHGVTDVFHYAPLHYILFIARSEALFSKNELRRFGYDISHFRRTSRCPDEQRGFSDYVHLTLNQFPPILRAKLAGGFPHFEVRVRAEDVEKGTVHLCRYNIAKCRCLRRGTETGFTASKANGQYHGDKQIPTAETIAECNDLLAQNLEIKMIEVLVPTKLDLTVDTRLIFFNPSDRELAGALLQPLRLGWRCELAKNATYQPQTRHVANVKRFLDRAAAHPQWRGDGLDFDYV